ncbi:uncharacterized protein LOC144225826 [Crocuta crocuta]
MRRTWSGHPLCPCPHDDGTRPDNCSVRVEDSQPRGGPVVSRTKLSSCRPCCWKRERDPRVPREMNDSRTGIYKAVHCIYSSDWLYDFLKNKDHLYLLYFVLNYLIYKSKMI